MSKSDLARLKEFMAPHRWRMLAAAALGAAGVLANVGLLGTSAYLLSRASLMPPLLDLLTLIVAVRFCGISRAVLRYAERYATHDVTFRILKTLRGWYYRQVAALEPGFLADAGAAGRFSNILGDLEVMKYYYLRVSNVRLIAALVLIATLGFLAAFDLRVAAVACGFFLLGGLALPWLCRTGFRRRYQGYQWARGELDSAILDFIQGLPDALLYAWQPRLLANIAEQRRLLRQEQRFLGGVDSFSGAVSGFCANLALWSALVLLIPRVSAGELSGVWLTTLVLVTWASFEAAQPLALALEYRDRTAAAAGNFFAGAQGPAPAQALEPQTLGDKSLEVRGLSFGYPGGPPVLEDISFTLAPGSKTALVGPSGVGKTTLIQLLLGFYQPGSGSILVGGVDLRELPQEQLWDTVGLLDQEPYLFSGTIRENLLLARAEAGEDELWWALDLANLKDLVADLPDGLDAFVGAGGMKLSGGQRQRLALCRLFLRDQDIVILDEATQSLDALNRREIMAALERWGREKTVLLITHDHYGLANMDNIITLAQGRILEQGSEGELLARDSYYRRIREALLWEQGQ